MCDSLHLYIMLENDGYMCGFRGLYVLRFEGGLLELDFSTTYRGLMVSNAWYTYPSNKVQ